MKPKAIIFDCDNTLIYSEFIFDEIQELGLTGDLKWDYFDNHCNSERVKAINNSVNFYRTLRHGIDDLAVIISTARSEKLKVETLGKLAIEGFICDRLYMRKIDDRRTPSEVKKDHLTEIKKNMILLHS